jgi:FAD/FMN-containing dehydrogenase
MSETHTPDGTAVTDLRSTVTGDVLARDDAGYDGARRLWNGAVDRRPAAIVRARSTDDVAASIAVARERGLALSVRGGGHHVTGAALVDDGVVIDLGEIDDVAIDVERRTARVGPGARVADVLGPAQEHGLAPVVGSAAQNGVAGSTLGGGIGWLRREFGLGIDSLRSVELVTADGEVLTASPDEHPDLFWAVRGAGATVGVVTEFELALHEVGPEVAVVQTMYPADAAAEVLAAYREFAATAPDEVTTLVALMRVPPLPDVPEAAVGAPVVMVLGVYAGPVDEGESAVAPLRELGGVDPAMDMSGPQPLAGVHEVARLLFPDGRRYSWHSIYADELREADLAAMTGALLSAPSDECELGIWHMGGAVADVGSDETAFGFREPEFLLSVDAAWEDPALDDDAVAWAREVWETLRESPATVEGFYPGFPGVVEGEERARMAYGDNLDRLTELKAAYDPESVFGHNLDVEPAR